MEVSPGSSTGGNDGFDRSGSLAEEELDAFNVPEVAVDEERKLREEREAREAREAREREVAGKKGGAAEGEKEDGVLNEGKYEQVRVLRVGRREARYGLWVVGSGVGEKKEVVRNERASSQFPRLADASIHNTRSLTRSLARSRTHP